MHNHTAVQKFSAQSQKARLLTSALAAVIIAAALAPQQVKAQDATDYAGNVIGGVAGALLGSRIGSGSGNVAATAGGAVIGSIVGGNVQHGMPAHQSRPVAAPVYSQPSYQPSYQPYNIYPQPQPVQPSYPSYDRSYGRPAAPRVYQQPSSYQTYPGHNERGYSGAVVGGVAGALAGSQIGKGNGKTAATAAMGVVGAIVGDRVQNGSTPVRSAAPTRYITPAVARPDQSYYPSGSRPYGFEQSSFPPSSNYQGQDSRQFTSDVQHHMNRTLTRMQRSYGVWVDAEADLADAQRSRARKTEIARLTSIADVNRKKFVVDRKEFERTYRDMDSMDVDVSGYATVLASHSDEGLRRSACQVRRECY